MLLFFIYKQSNPTLIYIWLTFFKWVNLFRRLSMRRIDELTAEINEATLQLQNIKNQMSKQFKEIWKLQCRKDMGKDYDEERYEDLMYNHKLLQMKRRQLITHINYLNKEFYEVLI